MSSNVISQVVLLHEYMKGTAIEVLHGRVLRLHIEAIAADCTRVALRIIEVHVAVAQQQEVDPLSESGSGVESEEEDLAAKSTDEHSFASLSELQSVEVPTADRGAYVVWRNSYFTLMDSPGKG